MFALMSLVLLTIPVGAVLANGGEITGIGAPSITIQPGSGMVAAGTGLVGVPSGDIEITVPAGNTVNQALLYWGDRVDPTFTGDDTVSIDDGSGAISVTGILIGSEVGDPVPPSNVVAMSYRADITGLVSFSTGLNTVTVSDFDTDGSEDGAGILLILDDGTAADVQIRDGADYANSGLNPAPPLSEIIPQTYTFDASPDARTAEIILFVGDVDFPRSNRVEVSIDGSVTETFVNQLTGLDGDATGMWDTFIRSITVPAGATSLTIEVISGDGDPNHQYGDMRPASLTLIMGGFSIAVDDIPPPPTPSPSPSPTPSPTPPPVIGGDGCTPGYWKQPQHFGSWVTYDMGDDYETIFGVDASFTLTLLDTLGQGGGGEIALGRHAVAALLNTANAGVEYGFTTAGVIAMVQDAYATGDFNGVKNTLATENELGCPLARAEVVEPSTTPEAGTDSNNNGNGKDKGKGKK